MALINCPECSHEVSDQAASCPNCGMSINKQTNAFTKKLNKKTLIIIVIVSAVAIGGIGTFLGIQGRNNRIEQERIEEEQRIEEERIAEEQRLEQEQIDLVIQKINAIGKVTFNSGAAISEAENAYNILNDTQKLSISNIQVLEEARSRFDKIALFIKVGEEETDGDYCFLSADKMSIEVDSNPQNKKSSDMTNDEIAKSLEMLDTIKRINEKFGFPESLYSQMEQTRALDGRQTQTFEDITISWSYHPNSGMQVIYSFLYDATTASGTDSKITSTTTTEETPMPEPTPIEIWELGYYKDEFDQPTSDEYVTTKDVIWGKFSNSATTNSELAVFMAIDKVDQGIGDINISIMLATYGRNVVKNSSTRNLDKYDITMRTPDDNRHNLTGTMYYGGNRIFIDNKHVDTVLEALNGKGELAFHIVDSERTTSTYHFEVEASNFSEIFQKLT